MRASRWPYYDRGLTIGGGKEVAVFHAGRGILKGRVQSTLFFVVESERVQLQVVLERALEEGGLAIVGGGLDCEC